MYFPKSQIKTDLHTKGDFLRYVSTKEEYTGDYFETSTNQYFSGKNPQDTPTVELELIPNNSKEYKQLTNRTTTTPSLGDPIVDESYLSIEEESNDSTTFFTLPSAYINSSNIKTDEMLTVSKSFHPTPTNDDYVFGAIERYFLKKRNEIQYKEINLDTYKEYANQNSKTQYRLYLPFSFTWQISGKNRDKVATTNYNIIKLKESRLRLRGLSEYFKNNYDQFFKKLP